MVQQWQLYYEMLWSEHCEAFSKTFPINQKVCNIIENMFKPQHNFISHAMSYAGLIQSGMITIKLQ